MNCFFHYTAMFLVGSLASAAVAQTPEEIERDYRTVITLRGVAKGGTLVWADGYNPSPSQVRIETRPGEGAASLSLRMVDALNESWQATSSGSAFAGSDGVIKATWGIAYRRDDIMFVLGGTELGLGIPPAPKNLSAFYDPSADEFLVNWSLPLDKEGKAVNYDKLYISISDGDSFAKPLLLPANSESHFSPLLRNRDGSLSLEKLGFYSIVYGVVDGVPSSPGAVSIDIAGNSMSEHLVHVFNNGVMPNWWAWHTEDPTKVLASEGHRMGFFPSGSGATYTSIAEKGTYQQLGVTGGRGGIARAVICELAGNYSTSLHLQIPSGLRSAQEDWHVSVWVTPIPSESMGAVPYWSALGENPLISNHEPFVTFNAETTNVYDEWLRIESTEPLGIGDGQFDGFLVIVEVSGTGPHHIGVDGLSVTRTASGPD